MQSLISICTDEGFVKSLEVACKVLQYRKSSYIDMIETLDKIKKFDDDSLYSDLVSMYKKELSEINDALGELSKMYVSLCRGLE